MEENKKIKNIKLTLYIIGILCLMVGVSYATYNLVLKGNKQHQVNIGSLTLTYEETNNINVTGDTLKTDEEGIASGNVFNFKVSVNNKTNKEINYIVYLTMDIEYLNNIDKGKVYLNNKTKNIVYGPSFITDLAKYKYENSYVLCTNTFTNATETHEYSLTSWISPKTNIFESGGTHQTIIGGTVKFKVSVETTGTPATDTLIALTDNKDNSGLYTITHPADNTLQIGATESVTEYRYRGANPKNYVTFNNETWRIIGVFPTDDGTGNIENRIKLIRNESIGEYAWNNCTSTNDLQCDDTNKYYNDWTGATLNTYLNGTYLNSLTGEAQSMTGNAKYYLGGYNNDLEIKKDVMYKYERKTSGSTYYYGTNPNSWVGKLALMYASDYGYAASDECTQTLYGYGNTTCKNNNWLFKGAVEWILPQFSDDYVSAFVLGSDGFFFDYVDVARHQLAARPVLYLTPVVQITGGSGTVDDPYTLGL